MYRYKLVIEYAGHHFCGWQRQASSFTVQQALEEAVQKFCGHEVAVTGSGRTDTGVHALGQVAHIDLPQYYEPVTVVRAINFYVKPYAVRVIRAVQVSDTFHARFSAEQRAYRYRIFMRDVVSPLLTDYVWHVPFAVDVQRMMGEARSFEGYHDFSSVRAAGCQGRSPLKTLDHFEVKQISQEEIWCEIRAKSFLYHQVRNMVGALVYLCRVDPLPSLKYRSIEELLFLKDRTKGAITAPASGLYFLETRYAEEHS